MRLDIAAGILAHTTLPLARSSTLHSPANRGKKKERSVIRQTDDNRSALIHDVKPASRNIRTNVMLEDKPRIVRAGSTRSSASKRANEDKACNPRSNHPDVGIFSCDMETHCIEDDESPLGGFCVAYKEARDAMVMSRQLQDGGLCNHNPECDCKDFDHGVGTYVCASSECIDDEGTICGIKEDVVVVTDEGTYRTTTCFVDTDGSPIESYCYTTLSSGFAKSGCELEYNGVMCASCSHVICDDELGGGEGLQFDCSNAVSDSRAMGSTCDGGDWKDFFLNSNGAPRPLTSVSTPVPEESTNTPDEHQQNVVDDSDSGGPETMIFEPMETPLDDSTSTPADTPAELAPTSNGNNLATNTSFMLLALVTLAVLAGVAAA